MNWKARALAASLAIAGAAAHAATEGTGAPSTAGANRCDAVGTVQKLTMRSGADFDFPALKSDDVGGKPSIVVIKLDGKEDDRYEIATDALVRLEGFKDLDGQQGTMRGLLLLGPLQSRLVGKTVELGCQETVMNKNLLGHYLVRLKVSAAPHPAPATPPRGK